MSMPVADVLLTIGWIIVPAMQFVCSDQRMRIILYGEAPFEGLALTDFTVAYLVLLVATAARVPLSAMRGRDKGASL